MSVCVLVYRLTWVRRAHELITCLPGPTCHLGVYNLRHCVYLKMRYMWVDIVSVPHFWSPDRRSCDGNHVMLETSPGCTCDAGPAAAAGWWGWGCSVKHSWRHQPLHTSLFSLPGTPSTHILLSPHPKVFVLLAVPVPFHFWSNHNSTKFLYLFIAWILDTAFNLQMLWTCYGNTLFLCGSSIVQMCLSKQILNSF